jgi:glycosyltransferase involved in cell wall biosynthesis
VRVLHVIAELGSGGAEAVVEELALAQRRRGDDVAVLTSGGRREAVLREAGVEVVRAPLEARSAAATLRALSAAAAARRTRPDVVHAHNVRATAVAHAAVRRLRRRPPLVSTFHGVAEEDHAAAARWLRRCADVVVAVSQASAERLDAAGGPPGTRVVPNAVTPPPAVERSAARAALGLADDVPVALCLARVVPQKRHDLLVRAWDAVPAPAVLVCAGDGPLLPGLREAAAARDGRVLVLGERSDVPLLLAAADALVLASDWEGLPMAVLEAMSVGLPLVATDVDGLREAVGDDAGVLVPPGDPAALGAALAALLSDAPRRRRAGAAARARVAARHAPAAMLAGYDAAYAAAASSAARCPGHAAARP